MKAEGLRVPERKAAIDMAAALFQPAAFEVRAPWYGGDLQTLHNFLRRPAVDFSCWPTRRVELAMDDDSGDRLLGSLHVPSKAHLGLVVLVHGLTGCEDSFYLQASAKHWLQTGYAVLRLNLRGAGPSRPLCREQYHAGRSEDLRDALISLRTLDPSVFDHGVFLVGYSLGGNLLLRFLAEEAAAFPVLAAASISAPIDLKAAQQRIMAGRNWLYHRYLLARMRREALGAPMRLDEAVRRSISSVKSVYDFDDQIVAPSNGFSGAEDYYARCSGLGFLDRIDCPTLVIHAQDDPWIPTESYRKCDWAANPSLCLAMPRSGGHVGFHGRGDGTPWHDQEIGRFFAQFGKRRR